MVRHSICKGESPYVLSRTGDLILECDKLGRPANEAEIAFIEQDHPLQDTIVRRICRLMTPAQFI